MKLPECHPEERWGLCLSGGADSVALLLKCLEVAFPVVALHFNHGFEDEEGDADEAFVRELCSAHGVPLVVGRCSEVWATGETKEVFARRHRMDFFAECVRKHALTGLFLAHHADDRAENVVLRLARGCGTEGLISFGFENPAPWNASVRLVRPLLNETHGDQIDWLKARGQSWREDVSNADVSIPRNAIRATLPKVLPHFSAGVNAAADLLAEENAFMSACAEAAIVQRDEAFLEVKSGTHTVLLRRILRQWLGELTRDQTERLLSLALKRSATVSGGRIIVRESPTQWVRLTSRTSECVPPIIIESTGEYRFGAWVITVGEATASLRLPLPLCVRSRRPGDRLRPRGLRGSRKVQDIMTDLHIPVTERDGYPLFFDSRGTLLAVPGYRPAAVAKDVPLFGISLQRLGEV